MINVWTIGMTSFLYTSYIYFIFWTKHFDGICWNSFKKMFELVSIHSSPTEVKLIQCMFCRHMLPSIGFSLAQFLWACTYVTKYHLCTHYILFSMHQKIHLYKWVKLDHCETHVQIFKVNDTCSYICYHVTVRPIFHINSDIISWGYF